MICNKKQISLYMNTLLSLEQRDKTLALVVIKGDNSCSTNNNQTSNRVKTTAGLFWVSMLSFCIVSN